MPTRIHIHRGNRVGGCVTEIWTKDTRVLIDFGEELPGTAHEKLPDLWNAANGKPPLNAVLFTHYHGDHTGRFQEACQHATLYMTELSRNVLANIHGYLAEHLPGLAVLTSGDKAVEMLEKASRSREALDMLMDKDRVRLLDPGGKVTVEIGDIRVTPIPVDHSAADACMLLVETPDRKILHTGDFRGHGAGGDGGKALLDELRRMDNIDTLIVEGTMMGRKDEKPYSEADLLDAARRFFHKPENRHVFLIVSSTNLDSIATFYRAASENGLPMYCHSPYVNTQVGELGRYASGKGTGPAMDDVETIVMGNTEQERRMLDAGFVAIIKANDKCRKLVEKFADADPAVVYSMWRGYYDRGLDKGLCQFVNFCGQKEIPVYPLTDDTYGPMHTSGHADPGLIAKVIEAASPSMEIRPIHTDNLGGFFEMELSDDPDRSNELRKLLNINGYRWVDDHRALSPKSLAKFLEDTNQRGSHRAFIELVKDRHPDELAFCLRGNSYNQAIIYYRNHIVFRVFARGKVEFDFGHARHIEGGFPSLPEQMSRLGFQFKEGQEAGIISMPAHRAAKATLDELDAAYGLIKSMIDSFSDASGLTEKRVQQQLFQHSELNRFQNGYYVYDMEFSQPHASDLDCTNQPDMLAVRFAADGTPERLVLIEVKSKPASLRGASGVGPHIRDMERYPDWLLSIRGRDACQILNQYQSLGLANGRRTPFNEEDFMHLPKEVLLIVTGEDTIRGLSAPSKAGGPTIEQNLSRRGYELMTNLVLDISDLDIARVYRKDFGNPVTTAVEEFAAK